jgi:tetratricopeptide (TPR) repeat protein
MAALLAVAGLAGCQEKTSTASAPAPKASPPPLPPDPPEVVGPVGPWEGETRSGEAFVADLRARREALEAKARLDPTDVESRLQLADVLFDLASAEGDLEHLLTVQALLDHALMFRPGDDAVLRRRDLLNRRTGHAAVLAAEQETRRFQRPGDAPLGRALAVSHWQAGAYARALELLDGVKPETPLAPDERIEIARVVFESGDFETADRHLRRAHLAVEGDSPLLRARIDHERGRLRMETGRCAEARPFLEAARRRLPGDASILEDLARCAATLGETDAALALYEQVIARNDSPTAHTAKARLLKKKGDPGADAAYLAADAAWRKAIDRFPYLYLEGAVRFWTDDRLDPDLINKWARMMKEMRRTATAELVVARSAALTGDKRWARELVDGTRRSPLRTATFFLERAATLKALGDEPAAREALAEARKIDPAAEAPAGL